MFSTILSLQPRAANAGGKSRDEMLAETARDIADKVRDDALRNTPPHTCLIRQLPCLTQVPNVFSLEAVADAYPTKYEESMNTVLQQVILMGSGCKYSASCSGPGVIRR